MEALRPSFADDDDDDESATGPRSTSGRNSSSANCASSSLDDALSFMSAYDLRFDSASSAIADPPATSTSSRTQESRTAQSPTSASASASVTTTTTTAPPSRAPRPQSRPRVAHGVKPSAARSQEEIRRRSKIVKLRDQVKELQDRRSELQSAPPVTHCDARAGHDGMSVVDSNAGGPSSPSSSASSAPATQTEGSSIHASAAMWLNQAVHQYQELQQAEAVNDNLRATLVKQIELRQLLDAQVQEHAALLPLPHVQAERGGLLCTAVSSAPRVSQGCPFIRIEQLHRSVASVRRGIDAVLQQFGPLSDLATSIFSSSQTKTDPTRGPVFELKSSAPVPSSVCDLARLLWKILGVAERASEDVEMVGDDDDPSGPELPPACPRDGAASPAATAEDSHEKWYTMKLQTQFGEVDVEGASVLCRYVETRRVAFAFASSIAVADSDMVFRESGWFVVAESEPVSSLFQTFYQLQPQHPGPVVAAAAAASAPGCGRGAAARTSADFAYLQDLVMNALGNRMRLHHQQLQSLLLKGAASKSGASPSLVRCSAASSPSYY